jgi:WD40 repeat protein
LLAVTVFPGPFIEGDSVVGGLYFWDMESQSLESIITGDGGYSLIASPNGHLLVTRIDEQLVGWDVVNNYETFRIKSIEGNADLISITDAGLFTTLSRTEGLKIWDFSGELIATLNTNTPIRDTVFMPDGRLLIAYSSEDNPPIEVWEIHE